MNLRTGFPRAVLRLAVAIGCAASALAASPDVARAQAAEPAAKHRFVLYTEGGRGADVRKLFNDALPDNVDEVTADDFKKALSKRGQTLPFGLTLTLESKRQNMLGRIGNAVADVDAEVALIGYVRKNKVGQQEVMLLAVERDKSEPSIDAVVVLDKDSTKADFEAALRDLVDAWKPKGGAAADGAADGAAGGDAGSGGDKKPEAPAPEDGEWQRPKNVYGHEIIGINASFDLGFRFFSYNDGITTNLRDYNVYAAPGVSARVEVFPFAPTGVLILRDIGFTGEFRMALGLSSETSDGTEVGTQWLRFGGGLRYRLPLGPKEKPFVLGLKGSFIQDGFALDATGDLAAESPSVSYNFMRVGLDGRFPIGPIALTAFGGYLGAISSGEVHERFRDSSIGGIDVGGGLTVPIVYGLEARLQAEYVRWFYAFAPVPGDAYVAGGALDEHIHIEIGPQYVF
jgi:hypothetical protein